MDEGRAGQDLFNARVFLRPKHMNAGDGISHQGYKPSRGAAKDELVIQVDFTARHAEPRADVDHRDDLPLHVDHAQNEFRRLWQWGDLNRLNDPFNGRQV